MIRLTSYTSGKAVSVSPELIKIVIEDANFTYVHFGPDEDCIKVSETRKEVARKVLEWRLALVDYSIFTERGATDGDYDIADDAMNRLYQLAGLEEPNHDEC